MKRFILLGLMFFTGCQSPGWLVFQRYQFTEFTMSRQRTAPASGAAAIDSGVVRLGHAAASRGIVSLAVSEQVEVDLIHKTGRPSLRMLAVVEGVHKFTHCTEITLTLYEDDILQLEQAIAKLRARKEKAKSQRTTEQESASDSVQQ